VQNDGDCSKVTPVSQLLNYRRELFHYRALCAFFWMVDLEEKLSQLVAYRRRSPPDDNAIGNLLLDIGRLHVERHESQKALDALHEALAIFERLGLQDRVRDSKVWVRARF
jgi:hypothetical protein